MFQALPMASHRGPHYLIIVNPQSRQLSPPQPPSSSSGASSFPILSISILGILTTAILLLSYYIFVKRCCLERHHRNSIRLRLSQIRRMRLSRRADRLSFSAVYSSTAVHHGLDESAIQAIPTFKFKRSGEHAQHGLSPNECAVCLSEFQQDERIRMLPGCLHVFHIDCIDTWLQTHSNCPLCRAEITSSSSVVIDVGGDEEAVGASPVSIHNDTSVCGNDRKLRKLPSMGDECINARGRGDDQFGVQQPVRRSFSTGSFSDQQLYRAVQEILRQNQHFRDVENGEGTSSASRRSRRSSFFSFGGHCRSPNQQ